MEALIERTWRTYRDASKEKWLVKPSAPVLFFGDADEFASSAIRVVTVALNPSRLEFPVANPFERFPGADTERPQQYLGALTGYFRAEPYTTWFNSYEKALGGMGASYYGGRRSTAIHTDIGSVLPTDPTWSGLPADVQALLASSGVPLWHELIERLQPDVLLWSTARSWLDRVHFAPIGDWNQILTFDKTDGGAPRKRPVEVRGRWYRLASERPVLLAFAPAAQTPLGRLSHDHKRIAGEAVLDVWRDGF